MTEYNFKSLSFIKVKQKKCLVYDDICNNNVT